MNENDQQNVQKWQFWHYVNPKLSCTLSNTLPAHHTLSLGKVSLGLLAALLTQANYLIASTVISS